MLNKLLLLGTAYAAAALSNATLNGIAADALWPEVATGCILRADFLNHIVELETSTGETRTVLSKDANPATVIPGPPQLCALKNDHDGDGKQRSVLTIATDLKYLRPWSHFLWNKLCYCKREGLDFLLFLGNVDTAHAPNPKCLSGKAGNHWIKAVAIHAALSRAGQDEVLVLDTDAIFRKESFSRHGLASCYFGVMEDAHASVAAGAEHYQVFVNAAVLLVRETPWTRALLRLWWRDRCGEKDQLILWHSLLTLWNKDSNLNYDGELLAYTSRDYKNKSSTSTYKHARRVVTFDYARQIRPAHFVKSPVARAHPIYHLAADRLLDFPDFALLPQTALPSPKRCRAEAALPSLRSNAARRKKGARGAGPASFLAHTKNRPAFDCCPAGNVDAAAPCVAVNLERSTHRKGESTPHR